MYLGNLNFQSIVELMRYFFQFTTTIILLLALTPPPKAGTSSGAPEGIMDAHL